jgi:thiol-disulfide isomerase/thioredoxin
MLLRAAVLGLMFSGALSFGFAGAASAQSVIAAPQLPGPAKPTHPTLSIATIDGKTFDLAAQRGHWVVVNFWATWCAPCLKEMPELAAFDRERDDVTVIGLAYDEIEIADLKAFLVDHPAGYPIALVDVYAPPKDFETPRGLPMTYLIAPDGAVAKKFLGPVSAKELAAAIGLATPVKAPGKSKAP